MNHRLKSAVFNGLETLPRHIGDGIYHAIQRLTSREPLEVMVREHERSLERFADILSQLGLSFAARTIGEIGSGWLPVTPYLLVSKYRASRVLTYDIAQHYEIGRLAQLNALFNSRFGAEFPADGHLQYRVTYHPHTNINTDPPSAPVDAVVSRNVLEHVAPDQISEMHVQAKRYLAPGGFIIHQISPSDHRAYSDKRLSLWDFLQYSQDEWNHIQTRFDFHNRLRLPHYLKIFADSGWRVLHCRHNGVNDHANLPVSIHEDYKGFSVQELTAGDIVVVLGQQA